LRCWLLVAKRTRQPRRWLDQQDRRDRRDNLDNREIRGRLDKRARRDSLETRDSRETRAKPAIADEPETRANKGKPHRVQRVSTNTRIRTMAERFASGTNGLNGNFGVAKRA
jgi:hypothetical protein